MSHIVPPQHILLNLQKRVTKNWDFYMEYSSAKRHAIRYSGLDFGDDVSAWEKWFAKYPRGVGRVYSTVKQCELLVKNLRSRHLGKIAKCSSKACTCLTQKTNQNFGDNADEWEQWIETNLENE